MFASDGEDVFCSRPDSSEKSAKWGGPELMKSVNNIWKVSDRGGMPVQVTASYQRESFFPVFQRTAGAIDPRKLSGALESGYDDR